MTVLNTFIKQPADSLDYDFDYSLFLAESDTIETAVFAVEPMGVTLYGEVVNPTFTKVWVRGGTIGVAYKVSCTVTTTHGRVKQDEIKIRVKEY